MRSNNNVSFVCKYRVVWCPKYRRQVLVNGADIRLKAIIRDVCRERSAELTGIHRLVKAIKGRSSRLLRQEFPQCRTRLPSLWTNSYFVSTVGGAPLAIIKKYIEHQKHV
jgi:putative transposase